MVMVARGVGAIGKSFVSMIIGQEHMLYARGEKLTTSYFEVINRRKARGVYSHSICSRSMMYNTVVRLLSRKDKASTAAQRRLQKVLVHC